MCSSSGQNTREARRPIGEMIHQVGRMHRQPVLNCIKRWADEHCHVVDDGALIV